MPYFSVPCAQLAFIQLLEILNETSSHQFHAMMASHFRKDCFLLHSPRSEDREGWYCCMAVLSVGGRLRVVDVEGYLRRELPLEPESAPHFTLDLRASTDACAGRPSSASRSLLNPDVSVAFASMRRFKVS